MLTPQQQVLLQLLKISEMILPDVSQTLPASNVQSQYAQGHVELAHEVAAFAPEKALKGLIAAMPYILRGSTLRQLAVGNIMQLVKEVSETNLILALDAVEVAKHYIEENSLYAAQLTQRAQPQSAKQRKPATTLKAARRPS